MMNYLFYDENLVYPDKNNNFCNPDEIYPEYPFKCNTPSKTSNSVYAAFRQMLVEMGLDKDNYGTQKWNPLGVWIKPGKRVLIKPNFVMHKNGSDCPDDLDSLVTHPSLIRCVLDYCYIALQGKGKVIVGDAPVKDCDFDLLMERRGYIEIEKFYEEYSPDFTIEFCDFRGPEEEGGQYKDIGHGVLVNLADKSWFYNCGHDEKRYRIPNYDYRKVVSHHTGDKQEYLINSVVLDSDVIISLPKPKTHRKNGYTAALKNFVGINYSKEYLPHHTEGANSVGGDEYITDGFWRKLSSKLRLHIDINRIRIDRMRKGGNDVKLKTALLFGAFSWRLYGKINTIDKFLSDKRNKSLSEKAREGTWYGNDTLWRTVLDLNYCLLYADSNGVVNDNKQRIILHIGDMVISGEKEGPMAPSPKEQHMLLFADNAVVFDCIVTKIMGFDYRKFIGLISAVDFPPLNKINYNDMKINSNVIKFTGKVQSIDFKEIIRPFIAGAGWMGHVEECDVKTNILS